MSIFNAPTFYSAPDRQTYSSGNFFIPQEKYTFGGMPRQVIPTGGITATTTANVLPRRILPFDQGDSGDDGNTIIGAKDPYAYTGPGSSKGTFNIEDIGEGTIDYEDIYYNPNNLSKADLAKMGLAYTLGGPITGIFQAIRTNKQREAREKAALQAELDREYGRRRADFADIRDGSAPSGGTWSGGEAAYSNPSTGISGGEFTDSLGNTDYQDAYDPGGGEKDGGFIDGTNRRMDFMGGGIANLVDIYD